MPQAKLPGFPRIARRRGRNERAVDEVAKLLRDQSDYDAHRAAFVVLARTTAAALDRLELDEDRSEHTVGSVARVHAYALDALRPAAGSGADLFEALTGELAAAVRDTSTD